MPANVNVEQIAKWLDSLHRVEGEAIEQAEKSGIFGVLEVRSADINSAVKIGLHTSVPAGKILHQAEEPASGKWLEKIRQFVPPWTIARRTPSIYPS